MCYEHFHECRFCGKHYSCEIENSLCPTLNLDKDRNLCEDCREELEKLLRESNYLTENEE